ncbi:PQQ-dependent sugar dehydrogenase [Glycomyces xiaoerkulensis]|uniref:PQQ-dependent sugar dehydrogenase n=1 Tax=Glycomyces xiaoerkulensis TaxID=2038139 RepID=UPI000C266DB4|nr:PQQ-dependent sugar dehydrogenase [Glycomyces xiaoerkulensis]
MSSDPNPSVRRRTVLGGLVGVGAAVAGCGDDDPPESPAPTSSPSAMESSPTPSDPSATPDMETGQEVVTGLAVPWGLAFLPDGDALVSERGSGRILRVSLSGSEPEEVHRVPDVAPDGEGGLLGLAVSPDYADDEYVYAYFTSDNDNRVVRFRLGEDSQSVFVGIAKANHHNGGRIAFGPDGMLYVATGDAGNTDRSQSPDNPNGKILRLTPEGDPAPGNPNEDSPVYSLGHRNIQGLAWDADERLYASEFGQNDVDEVNLIEPGANYGWPHVEGEGDTDGGRFTNPLATWPTTEASPSGIAIAGETLYMAALRGQRLWTMPVNGDGTLGEPEAIFEGEYGRLRTVEVAPDGALWLATSNTDGRGEVRDGDDRIIRFPAA